MAELPDEARQAYEAVTGETLPPPAQSEDKPPEDSPPEPTRTRKTRSDKGVPRGPRGSRRASSTAQIEKKLRDIANTTGGLVSAFEPYDGRIILNNADNLAASWAKVAERHPQFRQAIEGMEAGGVYGAAILSLLMVALPILLHHGMLPPAIQPFASVFDPATGLGANGNGSVPPMG